MFSLLVFCKIWNLHYFDLILAIIKVTPPRMFKNWPTWTNFPAKTDSLVIKIWCSSSILPKLWYSPSSVTFRLNCFWFILNVSVPLYCSLSSLIMSFLCIESSLVVNGPIDLCVLELLKKVANPIQYSKCFKKQEFWKQLIKHVFWG